MFIAIQTATQAAFKELKIVAPQYTEEGKCENCGQSLASIWMSKAKATLFLLAGINVIFTPWLIVGAQFYCVTQLHTEFPMANQIIWFSEACIMGLLGMSPWAIELLTRVAGAKLPYDSALNTKNKE